MHLETRPSCLSGYVVLAIFVAMTTTAAAAYLENLNGDGSSAISLLDRNGNFVGAPTARGGARHERSDNFRKRQSFSVTQDLDALAEMLREASMRRRVQNAIAFFNALRKKKKRDLESAYGRLFPEESKENRK